jgi:hypothetical protein
LLAAAALGASTSAAARAESESLSSELRDPVIRALLRSTKTADPVDPSSLAGELVPPPHGPIALTLLAITGILALTHIARLLGRLVLRYRSPAELRVSSKGVTIVSKSELLGRTLREREHHIPIEALSRATREVRYPRLPMYAGLLALGIGSYVGVSLFVDGARAGSPELLGMGAIFVVVGIALDYVLGTLASSARGRCRVVIVPRKGRAFAVAHVDPALADASLKRLTA